MLMNIKKHLVYLQTHSPESNMLYLIKYSISIRIYKANGYHLNTDILYENCPLALCDTTGYVMGLINQYRPQLDDILRHLERLYFKQLGY